MVLLTTATLLFEFNPKNSQTDSENNRGNYIKLSKLGWVSSGQDMSWRHMDGGLSLDKQTMLQE